MSYCIYGFRLTGDVECRYVGMTSRTPKARLADLTAEARWYSNVFTDRVAPDGLKQWLLDNKGNVDAFNIGKVETKREALDMERTLIALVLQLGHRLLNVQHVPYGQRIGWVSTIELRRQMLAEAA